MSETLRLCLPLVAAGQAQKHVTVNESLAALDDLVQLAVTDAGRTAPPSAPAEGDRHIVGASPTGAWAGRAGMIACRRDGGWAFYAPSAGWMAWVIADETVLVHDGAAWTPAVSRLSALGVGTTADPMNPLSVRADNVLFSARPVADGGGDMRVKVNRADALGAASHLFQSEWEGRAEFGLIGGDDFVLKVSPDGLQWTEALRVEAGSAAARFPAQGAAIPFSHGACRLICDDDVLRLVPEGGGGILIDGVMRSVPSAGAALAADDLAADVTWFIYAGWADGDIVLEAGDSEPVADAATGVMVSSDDPAITLVGMARTVSGPAWVDAPSRRLTRSWFRSPAVLASGALNAGATTVAGPDAAIDAAVTLKVLAWKGEALVAAASGSCVATGATGASFAIQAGAETIGRNVASLGAADVWSPSLTATFMASDHGLVTLACTAGASLSDLTWASADGPASARLRLSVFASR